MCAASSDSEDALNLKQLHRAFFLYWQRREAVIAIERERETQRQREKEHVRNEEKGSNILRGLFAAQ
jgi:hypothetical protein